MCQHEFQTAVGQAKRARSFKARVRATARTYRWSSFSPWRSPVFPSNQELLRFDATVSFAKTNRESFMSLWLSINEALPVQFFTFGINRNRKVLHIAASDLCIVDCYYYKLFKISCKLNFNTRISCMYILCNIIQVNITAMYSKL